MIWILFSEWFYSLLLGWVLFQHFKLKQSKWRKLFCLFKYYRGSLCFNWRELNCIKLLAHCYSFNNSVWSIYLLVHLGVGALVGVWVFSVVLQLPNMLSVALVLSTRCVRSVIMALASSGRHFYLATLISSPATVFSPLSRTELSLLVSRQDLGEHNNK